jgi:hypothetical protein
MIAKPRELSQQVLRTLVFVSTLVVIIAAFLWCTSEPTRTGLRSGQPVSAGTHFLGHRAQPDL